MKKYFSIIIIIIASKISAQESKYIILIDTIQHVNWPVGMSLSEAASNEQIEYPYYYTDHIEWEYDLKKMTAKWKGGNQVKEFKIYSVTKEGEKINLKIGDKKEIGWMVEITKQENGKTFFQSQNIELSEGKLDGHFSNNATLIAEM
ncbi:MAG: hypothetical protein ACK5D5_10665 [Bacteroidota bacterium]|jgi:hypothetical protein